MRVLLSDLTFGKISALLFRFSLFLLGVGSIACGPAFAQQAGGPDSTRLALIERYVGLVQDDPASNDSDLSEVEGILESARKVVDQATTRQKTLGDYQALADNADAILADLSEKEAELQAAPDIAGTMDDANFLQGQLTLLVAERTNLVEYEAGLQSRKAELAGRAEIIAAEIASARQAVSEKIKPSSVERLDALAPVEAARVALGDLEHDDQNALISDLQNELTTIPVRQKINVARLSLAEKRTMRLDESIKLVRDRLGETRLGIADGHIASSLSLQQRLALSVSVLEPAAADNVKLAERLRASVETSGALERRVITYKSQIVSLKQSAETVEQVLRTGTLTNDMGILLRELRSGLPSLSDLRKASTVAEKARIESQLGLIVLQDNQRRLLDRTLDPIATLKIASTQIVPNAAPTPQTRQAAMEIVDARADILNILVESAQTEHALRVEEGVALNEILELSSKLSARLDRRFLFMRTSESVNRQWLSNLAPGLAWILSPTSWGNALQDLVSSMAQHLSWLTIAILPPLGVWLLRPRLIRHLEAAGQRVGYVGLDEYWTTPLALAISLCLAAPWPWLIASTGALLLVGGAGSDPFSLSLGQALAALSSILFILTACRVMSRRGGLFAEHFGWSELARLKTRRLLTWTTVAFGVSSFFFVMAMTPGEVVLRYGVGIVSFIAISVATAFLSYQVFKPNRGIAASINPRTSASAWLVLALPILVGVPLVNGALPLLGFLDTGLALQLRVLRSVSYFVIAAVLYGLAMRLFLVANRRLALMASDERQAKLAERQSESAAASASGEAMPVLPDDLHDADLISNQVRFILLVSTGLLFLVALWFVWRTLIPALGIADELVLWSSQRQVGDQIIQTPVTLWSLLVALGLMTGGFALAHNIKGVLEVGLFQRIGLDVGARYAAVTVAGYVIAGAGLVFGFAQLGLDWSKLQWIIAAFGVGLGFGLQEVLANFVSGLIILFERPIRVGDTVTIGDLSGTVSDIRIRATTITDFDNREVLLPNKTIITENVSNWTLHNDVTRIVLPIGVAYGSDVERVRELLIAVARAHPDVLDAPSPTVFFMTHADSALEFEVRVFVASILKRFPVRHDLNAAINRTLREHGIEIPFPQRDVHLKEGPQPSQNRVLPINEPE